MRILFASLIVGAGALAYAQPGNVAGPSAGYVFDAAAQSVRQIRGIAGAATMGDPVDFGMSVAGAVIAPRGDFAIVTTDSDKPTHLFRLGNGTAKEVTSIDLGAGAAIAVFSPNGTAVALYRADGVQVLRGLPDAPETAFFAHVRTGIAQPVMAAVRVRPIAIGKIAVSDDGAVLLHANDGSVDVVTPAGSRKLADARSSSGLAFAPGSHDAAILTGSTLILFQDVSGAGTRQEFANVSASSSLAFSADGGKLLSTGLRAVTVLDRGTGDHQEVPCECRIGGLTRMGSMFRLNEPGDGPIWLLNPNQAQPTLVFVPARPGA